MEPVSLCIEFPKVALRMGDSVLPVYETPDNASFDGVVDNLISKSREAGEDDSFYVAELDDIVRLYELWSATLPRVHPFYAVKVNEDPGLLQLLSHLGTGFDCASKAEIEEVLALGVDPSRIVYAHPCKQPSNVIYAAQHGVSLTVIDNEHEIHKLHKLFPSTQLLVRIQADDSEADWKLGNKYGCSLDEAKRLTLIAQKLGMAVVGVSFHVGSGVRSARAFEDAIQDARKIFDYAWYSCGILMDLLDIGGGFPGSTEALIDFQQFCQGINKSLDEHFPASSNVRIIAEPGRFFAMMPYTLCTSVIAKRVLPTEGHRPMYYISDGKYGSLAYYPLEGKGSFRAVTAKTGQPEYTLRTKSASVWGPTCCGLDCVMTQVDLPEMEIGDWLVFDDMGAYTSANASEFNGFRKPRVVHTASAGVLSRIRNDAQQL